MCKFGGMKAALILVGVLAAGCGGSSTAGKGGPITDAAAGDPANVQAPAGGGAGSAPAGPGAGAAMDANANTGSTTPQ